MLATYSTTQTLDFLEIKGTAGSDLHRVGLAAIVASLPHYDAISLPIEAKASTMELTELPDCGTH
jgi:hypothetical protein